MEVTADCFEAVLPRVEEALVGCDYVAIDCEFTGLSLFPSRKEEVFDGVEQRYARVRQSAQSFLIIQFGLCAARWNGAAEAGGCYEAQTFNFYVFPRPYGNIDCRFTSQASSLDFLRHHNFDFNKFIHEGVPFLSLEQLEREEQYLANGLRARDPVQLTQEDDRAYVSSQMARVQTWLDSGSPLAPSQSGGAIADDGPVPLSQQGREAGADSGPNTTGLDLNAKPDGGPGGSPDGGAADTARGADGELSSAAEAHERLVLEPGNGFLRLALYQELDRVYGRHFFISETVKVPTERGVGDAVQLTRATAAAVEAHGAAREEDKRRRLREAAGFAHVMRALARCRKPVVGHNMLLDLAYMYHQFVGALPPTFHEFREKLLQLLPAGVVDTKHLAKQLPNVFTAGTSLGCVFDTATSGPQGDGDGAEVLSIGGEPAGVAASEANDRAEGDLLTDKGMSAIGEELAKPVIVLLNVSPGVASVPVDGGASNGAAVARLVVLPPFVHAEGFNRYRDLPTGAGMAHEAGYDAFMTAAAFSGLAQMLGARNAAPGMEADHNISQAKPLAWDAVRPYANKVNLMRSDMDHLPLAGPLPAPSRSHVFFVAGFPAKETSASLIKKVAEAGLGNTRPIWHDSVSVTLALSDTSMEPDTALQRLREAFAPACVTPHSEVVRPDRRRDADGRVPPSKHRKLNDGLAAPLPAPLAVAHSPLLKEGAVEFPHLEVKQASGSCTLL